MDTDKIKARIEYLTNICITEEATLPTEESKQACLSFVAKLPTPFDRPLLVVTYDGHLRAKWPYIEVEFIDEQKAKCVMLATLNGSTFLRTLVCLLESNKLFIETR